MADAKTETPVETKAEPAALGQNHAAGNFSQNQNRGMDRRGGPRRGGRFSGPVGNHQQGGNNFGGGPRGPRGPQNQGQNSNQNDYRSNMNVKQEDGKSDDRQQNQRGDRRGPGQGGSRFQSNGAGGNLRDREMDRINDKLMQISGPTVELPAIDTAEKKFSGRNRLYIGNLTNDATDEEITELFKPYGELNEVFLNKEKMYGFVRVDYYANAERAKRELDGHLRKGRPLKVRFAPNPASIRVKNLSPFVTNELLYHAFSAFGEIDRCVVIVDERGKSLGEGIVEFARKPAALCALRRCEENCFFLTSSLRPVIVEKCEPNDDIDGFSEKSLGTKKSQDWYKEREKGPRFAQPNSFEHEYGTRWKQLSEIYKQKIDALKREQAMEESKLEAQMEYAKYEHETEMLKEQLRARELDRERQKREWEMKEREVEEERLRRDEQLRRMQEDMMLRMNTQEEDLRRRQEENSLFLKAHQLSSMLEQQERFDTTVVGGGNIEAGLPQEPKALMEGLQRRGGNRGGGYDDNRGGMWNRGGNNRGNDEFQNKRRRY